MTPERWEQAGRLLLAAREIAPRDRAAFLEVECRGDAELKSELESLLSSLEPAEDFLERPAAGSFVSPDIPRHLVGAYELLEEIGRGGMGVVYKAVRTDQGFERFVALKLVKRGMDTDFILRRFESERRILAGLDHPNIARVLDGGSTEDGLPYFVMELIDGQSILDYCRERTLGTNERLQLFRQVCAAVQYAHQRLVIHRDLKPSNILVTAGGIPKLLDFGLAKVLAQEPGETVDRTKTEFRLLTPEYASPEQVRGEELTTASDVYSLGVVLYELLTGERPYRLKTRAPEELSSAILDQEPSRPSTKARLHRDLDSIVLMALRKEPSRRYASAEQLSEDIRRHLEGLPVKATPDSFGYRAGKFVRRHRVGVAAGILVAVSLVAGLAVSVWQMRVAHSERNRARAQAVRAEETARFLGSVFQGANPVLARGKTVTARALLDKGAERIGRELGGQPGVQASLLVVMSDAYDRLSAPREALALAQRALTLRERVFALRSVEVAESVYQVGRLLHRSGRSKEALPLLERAAALREDLLGPEHPDTAETAYSLAVNLDDLGRSAEARRLLEKTIAIQRRVSPASLILARLYNSLGAVVYAEDPAGARKAFESSVAAYEKVEDPENWQIAMPLVNLGELSRDDEDFVAAQAYYERVLAIDERVFGVENSNVAYTLAYLGDVKHARGDPEGARRLIERSIALYEKAGAGDRPLVAPLIYLGNVSLTQKRPAEARAHFERALSIAEKMHGPEHPAVAEALVALARAHDASGESQEAERLLRRALSIQRKALTPENRSLVPTLTLLARVLSETNRAAEARPFLEEAVVIARAKLPERHSQRLAAELALRPGS